MLSYHAESAQVSRSRGRLERKGLNTLCVQSAQSHTRSSEIAFLRTVLVWLSTCIPHQLNNFQTTQKRNFGRTRPRLRILYAL